MADYSYLLYKAYIFRWCYANCLTNHWMTNYFLNEAVSELLRVADSEEERRWWSEILSHLGG